MIEGAPDAVAPAPAVFPTIVERASDRVGADARGTTIVVDQPVHNWLYWPNVTRWATDWTPADDPTRQPNAWPRRSVSELVPCREAPLSPASLRR